MNAADFAQVVQSISALLTPIAVLGGLLLSLKNRGKIQEIRVLMNGRMDDLLRETREAAHARGILAGAAQRSETAEAVAKAASQVAADVAARAAVVASEVATRAATAASTAAIERQLDQHLDQP